MSISLVRVSIMFVPNTLLTLSTIGSINVSERHNEQYLVKLIKELVTSYLDDDKARILLACGADQDIHNSTTFRYIREAENDAKSRCMGVLTKLDLMHGSKAEQIWKMLDHQEFDFPNGSWFMTKQLSQDQLDAGVSHGEARLREADFFLTPPWADFSRAFPKQVGIGNLQAALSKCLTAHIIEA